MRLKGTRLWNTLTQAPIRKVFWHTTEMAPLHWTKKTLSHTNAHSWHYINQEQIVNTELFLTRSKMQFSCERIEDQWKCGTLVACQTGSLRKCIHWTSENESSIQNYSMWHKKLLPTDSNPSQYKSSKFITTWTWTTICRSVGSIVCSLKTKFFNTHDELHGNTPKLQFKTWPFLGDFVWLRLES